MKRAEKILAITGAFGITLKLFLIAGGGVLTVLSFVFLSMVYFFLSVALFNDIPLRTIFKKQSYAGISKLRIVGSILSGFVLSQLVLGIVFRIQSYPGAAISLIMGLFWLVIIFIIALIKIIQTKNIFYKRLVIRFAIIGGAGFILYMTPAWRLAGFFHPDHPAYIQALKNLSADPDNEELQEQVEQERQRMMSSDDDSGDDR